MKTYNNNNRWYIFIAFAILMILLLMFCGNGGGGGDDECKEVIAVERAVVEFDSNTINTGMREYVDDESEPEADPDPDPDPELSGGMERGEVKQNGIQSFRYQASQIDFNDQYESKEAPLELCLAWCDKGCDYDGHDEFGLKVVCHE